MLQEPVAEKESGLSPDQEFWLLVGTPFVFGILAFIVAVVLIARGDQRAGRTWTAGRIASGLFYALAVGGLFALGSCVAMFFGVRLFE